LVFPYFFGGMISTCCSWPTIGAGIDRFGSSLNGHVHFHVCVIDGVVKNAIGLPVTCRS
jgi:hypothetical protein